MAKDRITEYRHNRYIRNTRRFALGKDKIWTPCTCKKCLKIKTS